MAGDRVANGTVVGLPGNCKVDVYNGACSAVGFAPGNLRGTSLSGT